MKPPEKKPVPPSMPSPNKEPEVLGTLNASELATYRENAYRVRQLERDLARANLAQTEHLEKIRRNHRGLRWAKVGSIDEDTGEIRGKT
jgi:hypothetical protein